MTAARRNSGKTVDVQDNEEVENEGLLRRKLNTRNSKHASKLLHEVMQQEKLLQENCKVDVHNAKKFEEMETLKTLAIITPAKETALVR